jgi:hypothetical protein
MRVPRGAVPGLFLEMCVAAEERCFLGRELEIQSAFVQS